MKRPIILACAATVGAAPAFADPMIGIGVSIGLGGGGTPDLGISGHIWSNDQEDEFALGIGGAYYFGSQSFGADASIGYVFDGGVLGGGYDFLNQRPVLSLELADTDDGDDDDDDEMEVVEEEEEEETDGEDCGPGETFIPGFGCTSPLSGLQGLTLDRF